MRGTAFGDQSLWGNGLRRPKPFLKERFWIPKNFKEKRIGSPVWILLSLYGEGHRCSIAISPVAKSAVASGGPYPIRSMKVVYKQISQTCKVFGQAFRKAFPLRGRWRGLPRRMRCRISSAKAGNRKIYKVFGQAFLKSLPVHRRLTFVSFYHQKVK